MTFTLVCLLSAFNSSQRLDKLLVNIQGELVSVWTNDKLRYVISHDENDPIYAALVRDAHTAPYTILSLNSRINDSIIHDPLEVCKVKQNILPILKKIKMQSRKVETIYECTPDESGYAAWSIMPSITLIETIDNIYKACH